MKNKKISISTYSLQSMFGWERALELCKKNGFDAVDFNLECYNIGDEIYGSSEDEFISYFTAIKEKADSLELEIAQTHGRCIGSHPTDEKHNRWLQSVSEKDLYATSLLGAPSCVIHGASCNLWGRQSPFVLRDGCHKMYSDLIRAAEKYKVNIALETFGMTRIRGETICDIITYPEEMKKQHDILDTRYKTLCLDSGHTHHAGSCWVKSVADTARLFGKDLTLTHLHDNMGIRDDHLIPGMGNIAWSELFDAFDEISFDGVYNFEITLSYWGTFIEDALEFLGKYLRRFVDGHGKV